ncbi:MAG: peroxidase family protein [Phycisphaerales bacterium]|jgi:hypothetical protein
MLRLSHVARSAPATFYFDLRGVGSIIVSLATLAGGTAGAQQETIAGRLGDRDQWRQHQQGDPRHPGGPIAPQPSTGYRSYDGSGNNLQHAAWGVAGTNYLREASGAHYADGIGAPLDAGLPSPRLISNAVSAQGDLSTQDERGLSTAIYEFGQFLDHDIGLARGGSTESYDIRVPTGDPYFDPFSTGTQLIYLDRSAYHGGITSPRQQINTVTAFVDASHIYGSDAARAAWLREFQGGRLRVRHTAYGDMPPLNDGTQANDNPVGVPTNSLVVAGDVRANEQPGLTTLHIAFLREHNYQAARVAARNPRWNDEQLYQEARRIVGAEMQSITYNEFLPALLGRPLSPYRGYNRNVNPGISNVFAAAAYRFGHSQVGPDIGVIDNNFVEIDSIDLANAFFNPTIIPSVGGIDPFVRYMAIDDAQHIDTMIVDPLRNFLFGPPGSGGFDLASLNIQRGRDHGLGSFNQVRNDFGLKRRRSFAEVTSNPSLANALQSLYGSVDKLDAWVGVLAEDHMAGSSLGPTAAAIIEDQFTRLRDGDRFWYQIAGFDRNELARIDRTRLADILQRNSTVTGLQSNIFFAADLASRFACPADFDASGVLDEDDVTAFTVAYRRHDPAADFNGDGRIDPQDFDAFILAWTTGCSM